MVGVIRISSSSSSILSGFQKERIKYKKYWFNLKIEDPMLGRISILLTDKGEQSPINLETLPSLLILSKHPIFEVGMRHNDGYEKFTTIRNTMVAALEHRRRESLAGKEIGRQIEKSGKNADD